jgi:hypothetical protein
MRKTPRSGFFYSEELEQVVSLPDLEVHGGRLQQPIGFTAQHVAERRPKPANRVTKKPVKRESRRAGRTTPRRG